MSTAAEARIFHQLGTIGRAVFGLAPFFLLLLMLLLNARAVAQEIPLDSCRSLATIDATADSRRLRLLVDTGATSSVMNSKSFPQGDATRVEMHSWNGAFAADGSRTDIHDLVIGNRRLVAVSFLAVDLSDLERQCGEEIDGVMGADLIRKLGLEIDLKKHTARFAAEPGDVESDPADLPAQFQLCASALNRSDSVGFGDCLDPDVVLVDSGKSYRGRDAVLKFLDREYFGRRRAATLSIDRSAYHASGAAGWLEYDLCTQVRDRTVRERGTALFEKSGSKWHVLNLNQYFAPGSTARSLDHCETPQP